MSVYQHKKKFLKLKIYDVQIFFLLKMDEILRETAMMRGNMLKKQHDT